MKWVNPPVALMLHAGAPALMQSGVSLPMRAGDPQRLALEAYPGLLARRVLGRESYKSDEPARRFCPDRRAARVRLIEALGSGLNGSAPLDFGPWAQACLDDPGADLLDAVLCLVQAHQAWTARGERWLMPEPIDPVEGWIIGAPHATVRNAR